MGRCTIRLMETLTTLREISSAGIEILKTAESVFPGPEEVLNMKDKIDRINSLMRTMNYDWEYVPGEWDWNKKQAQK